MKFITEFELRALYKQQPFKTYALADDARLTPSARQFLLDVGVDMYKKTSEEKNNIDTVKEKPENQAEPQAEEAASKLEKEWLYLKIKSLKPQFLMTAQDLMAYDLHLAQQVTDLGRQFCLLSLMIEERCEVADLCCSKCEGIHEGNFSEPLGDCVSISEFHLQLKNGRAVLMLEQLKSALQLFEKELEMKQWDMACVGALRGKLNQIINKLSQLICLAIGGKECQRKM